MTGKNSKFVIVIALIAIAAASRFISLDMPNFSPIMAIALFGGAMLNRKLAYIVPIATMLLTDIYFGFHSSMFAVYGSFLLTVFMGQKFASKPNAKNVATTSVLAAVQFFLLTNLSVWAFSGMYTLDFAGLTSCFTMAVPFFRNTLASTMVFSAVLFGGFALASKAALKPAVAEVK